VVIPCVLILGIDTSGRQGSVALLRAQGAELSTLELTPLPGGQYSELLVPSIAGLLARHGFERSSIGLIAVASGPGSFTGLRIAIATVKGLAEAFATPVVAISVLEAIALAAGKEGQVIAALDAQRSEVFLGEYENESADPVSARLNREAISSFGDFASLPGAGDPPRQVFTPDAALAARLKEAGMAAELVARPSAEDFARIAYRKFLAGIRADVATLDANYLRRSDAEIFAVPKPGSARSEP
jgi:tRNA threonylcarbamoyladenosine biosynthesis protein TsaB